MYYSADQINDALYDLGDSVFPTPVFGPDRYKAARQLASAIAAQAPTKQDVVEHALLSSHPHARKIMTFDNGKLYIDNVYHEYRDLKDMLRDAADPK